MISLITCGRIPYAKNLKLSPFYLTFVLMSPQSFPSHFKPFSAITDVNSTTALFRNSPSNTGFSCASRVHTLPHKMVKLNA